MIESREGRLPVISESELIGRAQSGDSDAFCQLARHYERRIYLLALHYCRDPHDAEDLSQEVWLKAYRNIAGFRGDASFYTWLRQITINTFLNHRRAASVFGKKVTTIESGGREMIEDMETLGGERRRDAEKEMGDKILVRRVMESLGELTAQQRLIFLLKHREGMTYEEIAESLNCSTGTVKKALFRAVSKLRKQLGVEAGAADCAPIAAGESC